MDISGALQSKKVSCRTGILILQLSPFFCYINCDGKIDFYFLTCPKFTMHNISGISLLVSCWLVRQNFGMDEPTSQPWSLGTSICKRATSQCSGFELLLQVILYSDIIKCNGTVSTYMRGKSFLKMVTKKSVCLGFFWQVSVTLSQCQGYKVTNQSWCANLSMALDHMNLRMVTGLAVTKS